MVGTGPMGIAEGFGEVAVPAARPIVVVLVCLVLAACTGGGEPEAPAAPAEPSLQLTVVSMPLSCQAVPGVPEGCQVGGSGVVSGLGKVRVYHSVRLGFPRPGGCREATTTGSLSGGSWSVPFSAGGEWCGQRAQFTYRLAGPSGGQGRLEYRHEPPAAATLTFTGAQPKPPAAAMACDLAGRVASVAVVAGALYTEPGECRPSRPIAVLAIHGTNDVVVPYGGRSPTVEWPLPMPPMPEWLSEWAARDGCPGDPAVFFDTPAVTGSAGAAAATAPRSSTTASTAAATRHHEPSTAARSPRSPGTSSLPTHSRADLRADPGLVLQPHFAADGAGAG
jgi:hypothetical protein